MGFPYRQIFEKAEETLLAYGSKRVPLNELRERLDRFKTFEGRKLSDAEFFSILVSIVFYSGFKAATVSAKLPVIWGHFPDYKTVAAYTKNDVARILHDPDMIRHPRKIEACVNNAIAFTAMIQKHGSFQQYIDSFKATTSEENLMLLKKELQHRFDYLGGITAYHFMTDMGLPVLKPDRVVSRIFYRLGATQTENDVVEAVNQGKKFARQPGCPSAISISCSLSTDKRSRWNSASIGAFVSRSRGAACAVSPSSADTSSEECKSGVIVRIHVA
jgi:DNA-3-methyladenine glycosylase I